MDSSFCPYCRHAKSVFFSVRNPFRPAVRAASCGAPRRQRSAAFTKYRICAGSPMHGGTACPKPRGSGGAAVRRLLFPALLASDAAGVLILADGRPLGCVENAEVLSGMVREIEQSASAAAGKAYALPYSLSVQTLRAPACEFLSENELRGSLTAQQRRTRYARGHIGGRQTNRYLPERRRSADTA